MSKLTAEEAERLDSHNAMVVRAMNDGDMKAVAALHADEGMKALSERKDTESADGIVRGWFAKLAGPHLAFKTIRAAVRFTMRLIDTHQRNLQLQGAALTKLSERLAELEGESLRDAGVFESGKSYGAGMVTTHRNSAWVAKRATCDTPGTSSDWRMLSRGVQR